MNLEPIRHARLRRALLTPALAATMLLATAAAAQASTILVNTTSDTAPADGECSGNAGDCSLRQAVDAAQPDDTIDLGANTYTLTRGSDIDITKSLTLEGMGDGATSIDGSGNEDTAHGELARILRVERGASVAIQDLTLTNGNDSADENCPSTCDTLQENGGGALFNNGGSVALTRVAFTNDGGGLGGALSTNGGSVSLTNVSFTDDGGYIGGALFTRGGTVTGDGVVFHNDASSPTDNAAAYLYGGNVTFTNTTVADNGGASSRGGGIDNGGASLTLVNDTFSGNLRGSLLTDQGATTTVQNTIIGAGFSDGSDFACIAPGYTDAVNDRTTANAITTDGGHNIDQDGHCGLTDPSDVSGQDPQLAPIADNGGSTLTQALLAGSPALGDPASTGCPSIDQRGQQRPDGSCDIGAFEAVLIDAPTATTGGAQDVTDSSADLSATINLRGEAGGYHFMYGTSDDPADFTASREIAAGVPDGDTSETETLSDLTPATTYYYEAVADNATASATGDIEQFTTPAGPPVLSNVIVASVTDTTATITFTIDSEGSDTKYLVAYGPDENYGWFSEPTDLGSPPGPQNLSVTLTGLTPSSTYHFAVYAGNDVQHGVNSGDQTFNTYQQVTGVVGTPVAVNDSGSGYDCPTPESVAVDWGDDSPDNNAQIQCQPGQEDETDYTLSDTHTYSAPGDYLIQITYNDFGRTTDVYAHIVEPPLSNTGLPIISGTAKQGQTLTTTHGAWNGNPTAFHYQWEDCDQNGQNCSDVGDDANSYTLTGDDVGHTIRVIATASDDAGDSSHATSHPTATVIPLAPTNAGAPEITGPAQQGQSLISTTGSWDGNPKSYDYQWQDCDQNGHNCTNTGADSNSYTLTNDDVGHTVQVLVTATNDGGQSTPAASSLTAVVQSQTQPSPPAPNTPAPNSPPASQPSSPTVLTSVPSVSVTGAGFSGSVTPNGLPTQAYFQYALDPKYTGGGPLRYDESTPAQTVGSDFTSHTLGPVPVSGLLPNALYHVRLVAINSDGTTFGPDVTFITQAGPVPGLPILGKTVNISPINGLVLIEEHGKFVPLTELDQIPSGSVIDATHGTLEVITATGRKGKTQHGEFGGAVFRITQGRSGTNKGVTTLRLLEGLFKHGPSYGICKLHKAHDVFATAAKSTTLQLLHASAHGKFTTKGRYSAATVLGTKWTIGDRCDGTLVHDLTDSVVVTDFVHHKKIVLHAGQSYLAVAPTHHK